MKRLVYVPGLRALCLSLVLAAASAHATDYYVSTSGSDSNPGTSASPFRTITHAYSVASAGTTIHVASGVYNDYTSGWGIHLGKSGTASSPIVLESQVVGGAIIDGGNASDRNQGFYIDGNYNVVDGFEIRNCPNGGISIWSSGNQILNNHIHNNGNPASSSTNGRDGVYSDQGTSGNVYAANWIDHNGRSGSNLDHGLYLCGDNEVVVNNVLLANAACGLQIAGYTTVSNMKVYNNVMAWNGTCGIILWQALSGVDIKNNVLYQNGHYGIGSYAATGSGVVVNNNLAYGNGSGSFDFTGGGSTYSYSQSSSINADPHFANAAASSFDPHLTSGSPAIQAGLNLSSTLNTDMSGAARPASGAWDLGVYVNGSTTTADKTPPTVSITAPANGATVSGSAVTISANASDNVGVTSVQFKLDGGILGSALTKSPYTLSWSTTGAANGTHTLSATASDAAGNQATASISVTVNNATAAPTVSLTAPASGARYSAPATVNLSANVTANGHTITAVQFYNGSTLLGQLTTAPYSFSWNNVAAGSYSLSAKAVYDSGSTVASSSASVTVTAAATTSSLTFPSTSGTISAPFFVTNGTAIVQPAYTSLAASGQVVYNVNIPTAGNYVVSALVSAPTADNNSFWVNIDAQPADPTMIWDIPVAAGAVSQTVSWRGNGTVSSSSPSGLTAQFAPKVFNLSAGTHQLIIRGREGKTQLGTITISPTTLPAN